MTAQATRFDAAAACFSGAELAQSFALARAAAKDRVLTLGLPQNVTNIGAIVTPRA